MARKTVRQAFFVMGVENSGNRMFRNALCSVGCYGDPLKGESAFKDLVFDDKPDRIAILRSIPYGNKVPDLKAVARAAQLAGYEITPILMYRKTEFSIAGQMKVYQRTEAKALMYRKLATRLAYDLAAWLGTVLITVPYEPFVTDRWVRANLFTQLGLAAPALTFFNANEKYGLEGPPLST